jgi:hypothetical protein
MKWMENEYAELTMYADHLVLEVCRGDGLDIQLQWRKQEKFSGESLGKQRDGNVILKCIFGKYSVWM